jgi:hypothetical protein
LLLSFLPNVKVEARGKGMLESNYWRPARVATHAFPDAPQPIARLTVAMHHRNDQNVINLDRVEQRVREYLGQTTTDICLEDAPTLWRLHNLSNGSLDTLNEP